MAHIILTTGEMRVIEKEKLSLEFMQRTVGGYIQVVPLGGSTVLVCNEEGKLKGLPLNDKATLLWEKVYGKTDIIVGNVIIAKSNEID